MKSFPWRWSRRRSPAVNFMTEDGRELRPWAVRAGMKIIQTDYSVNRSLVCTVRDDGATPRV